MRLTIMKTLVLAMILVSSHTWAEEGHSHKKHQHNSSHKHSEAKATGAEGTVALEPAILQRMEIEIGTATRKSIDEHITLTGRISPNRNTTASVPARFPAVIEEMYVTWGEKVRKGEVLASLKSRTTSTRYTLTSPIDGVVLERNANLGDLVDDEAVFVIADLSNVWAEFHVFPRDLAKVKKALPVHVVSLEDDQETTALINIVMPTADAFSQTIIAVVELPNTENSWRPGMTVEGDVHLAKSGIEVLAIKQNAVQRMHGKSVIFVQQGGSFVPRPVVLGKRDDTYVEVLEGVSEGEKYVAEGSFIIKAELGKAEASHDHAH